MKPTKKRLLIAFSSLLSIYLIVGFWVVPQVLKSQVPTQFKMFVNRDITIENIKFNPILFSLEIENLEIFEPNKKPMLSLDQFLIDVSLASVFTMSIKLDELLIHGAQIHTTRDSNNKFDFENLIIPQATDSLKEPKKTKSEIIPIEITHFSFQEGHFEFIDQSQKESSTFSFSPISFEVDDFSTAIQDGEENQYNLKVQGTEGGLFEWKGNFQLQPFISSGSMQISGLVLNQILPLLQNRFPVKIPTGEFSFQTDYKVQVEPDIQFSLSKGTYTLNDFYLYSPKDSIHTQVKIPLLQLSDFSVNSQTRILNLNKIDIQNTEVATNLNSNGLSLAQLSPKTSEAKPPQKKDSLDSTKTKATLFIEHLLDLKAWKWNLDTTQISNLSFKLYDKTLTKPATAAIDSFNLELTSVNNKPDNQILLSSSLNLFETGKISLKGQGDFINQKANLSLNTQAIPLTPLNPWLESFVYSKIASGYFSNLLNLQLTLDSTLAPSINTQGSITLQDLKVNDAYNRNLLLASQIKVNQIQANLTNPKINIGEVSLKGIKSYIQKNQNGSLNLTSQVIPKKPTPQKASKSTKPTPIVVSKVTLNNSSIYFTDKTVSPNFKSKVTQISAKVTGISTTSSPKSKISVKGKIEGSSPFNLEGSGRLNLGKPYINMKLTTQGQDMTHFSPYSGKFAGLLIQKGVVSTDLKYSLKNNFIDGNNRILIDQLTFGKSVESKDATSLPVKLGVALLSDRKGLIDLDVGVKGNLKDPSFSVVDVVWDVIGNLISKAALSPLSLLMGGSSEDAEKVSFEAGSTKLATSYQETLNNLAEELSHRPKIKMELRAEIGKNDINQLILDSISRFADSNNSLDAKTWKTKDEFIKLYSSQVKGLFNNDLRNFEKELAQKSLENQMSDSPLTAIELNNLILNSCLDTIFTEIDLPQAILSALAQERVSQVKSALTHSQKLDASRVLAVNDSQSPQKKIEIGHVNLLIQVD